MEEEKKESDNKSELKGKLKNAVEVKKLLPISN